MSTTDTIHRPRPAALALAEAFDRAMTRDDLRHLTDAELSRFGSIMNNWWQLGASERDRRTRR